MFGKDMQLFYRQWQAHLDQGVAYWQAMMQTQAHSLEALLAVWSATTRLGVAPSPLLQSWTQAVAQWFEGYARVVSTALTGHDVTAHRQVAHLTEHVTELANITARLEQCLVSLSDLQARATPATDRLLQRLQDMQEALEQRLHTLTEQLQETEVKRTSPPSRSTTRRRPPSP